MYNLTTIANKIKVGNADTWNGCFPSDNTFQIPTKKAIEDGFPYPIKVIDLVDYSRYLIVVRTDAYPLIWLYYSIKHKAGMYYHFKFTPLVYWLLRNKLNNGYDFAPGREIGGLFNMIKLFVAYKMK